MNDTATLDLSALTDDGDTLELPDGRTLRLRIEPDEDMSIFDEQGEGEWCGRIEWDDIRRTNDCGYVVRPDGFTGRAEVILRERRSRLWWEVPADVVIGSEPYRALRQTILDLLNFGYKSVGLELIESCDHGGEHVVNSAWIGGCDSLAHGGETQVTGSQWL